MTDVESISKVIAALHDLGYTEVSRRGDLVAFDVLSLGAGFPIILDLSRDTIPRGDLLDQLDDAGVDRASFFAAIDAQA